MIRTLVHLLHVRVSIGLKNLIKFSFKNFNAADEMCMNSCFIEQGIQKRTIHSDAD
jgi:hypothetical protein